MCEIVTSIDRDADLTVRTVTGEVTAREIEEAMASYYAGEPTRLLLWEFSGAVLDHMTTAEVRSLAESAGRYIAGRRGGKTALVFASPVAFGLGRMFDQAGNVPGSPVAYRSFHDRAKAMEWLTEA